MMKSYIFKILYIDKSEIVVNHAFAIRKINKEDAVQYLELCSDTEYGIVNCA